MTYADLIGVPFVEGGRDRTGLDCWGVVLEWYRRQGVLLKDPFRLETQASLKQAHVLPADQWIARQFDHWRRVERPEVGSVVAFRDVEGAAVHVAVLVASGLVLHALRRCGVVVSKLDREPWCSAMMGVYVYCP